jgi:thiol-disulfide isomerase/thioredoxin
MRRMHSLLVRNLVWGIWSLLFTPLVAALKVGDAAPKIQVSRWVQGEEVKKFEGDKVYIVEFWATWCGPCVASIPHLNEIHQRFKDKGLVVIGQNVMEEDAKAPVDFVKKMGGKMTYRVTLDDKASDGFMARNWLTAAEQNGIPCAFVINKKGKIAYIGHPMSLKDSVLETLLAEPSTKAPEVAAAGSADTAIAPSAEATALATRAETEIRAGKLDVAESTIAELHGVLTDKFRYLGGLLDMDVLIARRQPDDAIQLARIICEDFAGKPRVLTAVATHLISQPDASVALQTAAEKIVSPISNDDGEGRSSAFSTLARIAFQRGEKDRAVELQTQALTHASPAEVSAAKAVLASYQTGEHP